jgi:2-methylisocitrate lyase-like PEP mutase family enzyme
MDTQKKSARLKSLVARRDAIVLPGTPNALFARVIETMGFPAAYVTGAGIANMQLGVPDIGLTSVTEIADAVSRISDVVSIPLLVDGDTGFGNPVNVIHTIRLFEKAGASGIQMEDDGMLASFEVRQNAVNKSYFDELEKRYATPAKASAAIRRGAS